MQEMELKVRGQKEEMKFFHKRIKVLKMELEKSQKEVLHLQKLLQQKNKEGEEADCKEDKSIRKEHPATSQR